MPQWVHLEPIRAWFVVVLSLRLVSCCLLFVFDVVVIVVAVVVVVWLLCSRMAFCVPSVYRLYRGTPVAGLLRLGDEKRAFFQVYKCTSVHKLRWN